MPWAWILDCGIKLNTVTVDIMYLDAASSCCLDFWNREPCIACNMCFVVATRKVTSTVTKFDQGHPNP